MIKWLIFSAVCALAFSCTDLFSTREDQVEEPDEGSLSGIYEEPTTPENVLRNFSRSLERKDVPKYMDSFANPSFEGAHTYRFFGDPRYAEDFLQSWGYQDEFTYINNVVNGLNDPIIRFSIIDSVAFTPINFLAADDSVISDFFSYQLVVETRDSVRIYMGDTRLKLYREKELANEPWLIYEWTDRELPGENAQSWTFLKLENR